MDDKVDTWVESLLSAACDGPLSPADQARLDELLRTNADARKAWLAVARLHTSLSIQSRSELSVKRSVDAIRESIAADASPTELASCGPDEACGSSLVALGPEDVYRPEPSRRYRLVGAMAIGASIAIMAGLAWNQLMTAGEDRVAAAEDAPAEDVVAKIVRKVDCNLESDHWAVSSSADIVAGQTLILSQGLMELEFTSGAVVTLQAPVTFTVDSGQHGTLAQGKLSAYCPESAHGFSVTTPRGDVIDLGTRFGVMVRGNGDAETHVFEGEVIVRPGAQTGLAGEQRLQDNMAVRLSEDETKSRAINVTRARFAQLDFVGGPSLPAPVVERGLCLWFSAEGRVQTDERQRVVSWGDLPTGSNTASEDAWQVQHRKRPQWVSEGIGGRPAIRFDGGQSLITKPLVLNSSVTGVAVVRVDVDWFRDLGPKDGSGLQFLNTNGLPRFVFGFSSDYGLFSRMRLGPRRVGNSVIEEDASSISTPGGIVSNKPMVVCSVYDSDRNSARLYLNGQVLGDTSAPPLTSTNSTRHIGAHFMPSEGKYFAGEMAELLVYDTGLVDEEVQRLTDALMERYGIARGASAP